MNPTDTASPAPRPWRRLAAVLLLLALLWAVFEFTGLRARINPQALRDGFAQHSVWGFVAFTALFALGNLIQLPGWIFLASAVLALGPVWGALATFCAALVSCVVTFFVVRAFGANALRELPGPLARRLFARLDAHPIRSVALLRLVFQTVPAMNYALALSGLRFRDYLLGTLIGLPGPVFVYAAFFDTLAGWMGWTLR
ncbi:TVP38/TMEM64 family protein [Roseateles sp. BYS78W]|uniref:TVP38/TMEM64 family membrane protein n=1 Tax=Pelomonas candidula TaxID=3299025 RepID=A0ABW7HF88_9BURK